MAGTTPTISIIVPVYNAAKTLRRCVDSVLKQEYPEFELILVDAASRATAMPGRMGGCR